MTLAASSQTRPDSEIKSLKGALPFRLGTTSYIIPADILPNLLHLKDRIDDVELVLFESDQCSNLPTESQVDAIAQLGRQSALSYTVHLPLDTRLGSVDETERRASVEKCRRVVSLMCPIEPFAWILHLHGDNPGAHPSLHIKKWMKQNRRSLRELLENGPPSRTICVETLDYDFDLVGDLVNAFDLSVCVDIGHLLLGGRDIPGHLNKWMDRARVFHLHGIDPSGCDHHHLGYFPAGVLENLATRLSQLPPSDQRVVTMEVFGEEDFEMSMITVSEKLKLWRK
jgi:sugar phosphate isomerase/epimerase